MAVSVIVCALWNHALLSISIVVSKRDRFFLGKNTLAPGSGRGFCFVSAFFANVRQHGRFLVSRRCFSVGRGTRGKEYRVSSL